MIIALPADMPDIIPVDDPMAIIEALEDDHNPPVVELPRVAVLPIQILVAPEIFAGLGFTVNAIVVMLPARE